MRTAVDSSVLLDVIVGDAGFADRSEAALRAATAAGSLTVCECVVAEIRPAFAAGQIEDFLDDWQLEFVPSTRESSVLAGEMFAAYLRRRLGRGVRVLPDFLIGAHAQAEGLKLVTRDPDRVRTYFPSVELVSP